MTTVSDSPNHGAPDLSPEAVERLAKRVAGMPYPDPCYETAATLRALSAERFRLDAVRESIANELARVQAERPIITINGDGECTDVSFRGQGVWTPGKLSAVALRKALAEVQAERDAMLLPVDCAKFMNRPPCYICGYNGPGYYDSKKHQCAAHYHAALAAMKEKP